MKFIFVFAALFALAMANRDAETLHYENNVEPENFSYSLQTSDGKTVEEQGVLENAGTDDEALSVRGSILRRVVYFKVVVRYIILYFCPLQISALS